MRLWVIPPFGDGSLSWVPPEPDRLIDLNRAFLERVLLPAHLTAVASQLEARLESMGEAGVVAFLQLQTGRRLIVSDDPVRKLRATGAILSGISSAPSRVRLRLDDLELAHGTTQSSADSLEAARGPLPFAAELESSLPLSEATTVVLWLERDQQVPAVLALAPRLPRTRLALAGPFAREHSEALRRIELLRDVPVLDASLRPVAIGFPGNPLEPIAWRFAGAPIPAEHWAGEVSPTELLERPACSVAVVAFCATDGETLLANEGSRVELPRLVEAASRLREHGARIMGEWWLGAPGVSEDAHRRTLDVLGNQNLFDFVGGLRLFHWARGRPTSQWPDAGVTFKDSESALDLGRYRDFEAPGTLRGPPLHALVDALAKELRAMHPLVPGRVAQAYLAPAESRVDRGNVQLDPDAALVTSPMTLRAEKKPTDYFVNLRTGAIAAIDGRLRAMIDPLQVPTPRTQALAGLPEAQRAQLLNGLVAKGFLVGC